MIKAITKNTTKIFFSDIFLVAAGNTDKNEEEISENVKDANDEKTQNGEALDEEKENQIKDSNAGFELVNSC